MNTSLQSDLLEGLSHTVGLDVRIPVLLPAVALSTHLALERLQAHVFVHMLLEILRFIKALITAAGEKRKGESNVSPPLQNYAGEKLLTENKKTDGLQVLADAFSDVCSEQRLDGRWLHTCCRDTLIHL